MKLTTLCYIEKDDCYLMLYRNKKEVDQNKGKWIGIGGKFEYGETPDECMMREIYEETGLTPVSYALRGVISFISDIYDNEYMFLYSVTDFTGTLNSDCDEGMLKWIPKSEIMNLNVWEGDRLFLQKLIDGQEHIDMKLVYKGDKLVKWTEFSDSCHHMNVD